MKDIVSRVQRDLPDEKDVKDLVTRIRKELPDEKDFRAFVARIQQDLPDEKEMKDLVSRAQRELPDTNRDRYDVAYQRGRSQARSGLLLGGLAVGSLVGAGLMWLLDPVRGAARRAQLSSRATGLKNDLARKMEGRSEDLQNRAKGFAIEHGVMDPEAQGREPVATGTVGATEYGEHGAAGPVAGAGATLEEPAHHEEVPAGR